MECMFTKKYEKVDSFLKRVLPNSRHTGVRLIEPCVAVSSVYNKLFKFAVLADDWLYVTENPPKVAKDIQEVTRIVDITSVELINDVPEFLGGDLKYRAHHILVTFNKVSAESELASQLTPDSSPPLLTRSLQENDLRKSARISSSLQQENDLRKSRKGFSTVKDGGYREQDIVEHKTTRLKQGKDRTGLSKSQQENDFRKSRKKSTSNELDADYSLGQTSSRKSLSPVLASRDTQVAARKSRIRNSHSGNSLDQDYLYENDSSLANSKTLEPNQVQANRLSPTARTLRDTEKSRRRKSSPVTFSKDESIDKSSVRRSSDGRVAKSGKSNVSPRLEVRTLPGKEFQRYKQKPSPNSLVSNESESSGQDINSKSRVLPLVKLNSLDSEDENFESTPALHHSFSTLDDFKSKNSPKATRLTVSASAADLRAALVEFDPKISTLNSGSEPNLTSTPKSGLMGSFNGLQSWLKERRVSKSGDKSAGQSSDGLEDGLVEEGTKSGEIHLYMILDDTVMLAYLRSIWDNCLLNSALKYAKKGRSPKTIVKNKPNSSQVTALFNQLEKEILNSEDFEATFELVHELLTACQKDVLVKKLFWQSPDLFVFLVKKVNQYIKERPDEPRKRNRADELEFTLLLFECLTEMFRETELLASRMTRLKTRKYSVVRDLVIASITCPDLNKTSTFIETPDISEAAQVLLTGKYRKKKEKKEKTPQDIELENLSNELIKHQVCLLHELFIVAYQAVWFPTDDKTLNVSWIVKLIESATTVYRFFQVFVQQVVDVTTKAEKDSLSSDDTTVLYRLLSVLKTLLQQSLKLRKHIHDYYTEEFRYYVKPHTISNSLSQECPLTPSTLKLVDDVIALVTDVPSSSRRPAR